MTTDTARESAHLLLLRVNSRPTPQGSKRALVHKSTGRAVVMESAGERLRDWRADVRHAVEQAMLRTGYETTSAPIEVRLLFYLLRPASHYRTGRNRHLLRDHAPTHPHVRPDLDKLIRSTLDAIGSAGAWRDDCQVVALYVYKLYAAEGEMPGAAITIRAIQPPEVEPL
jgi:crossover junction endodeoxyribonuclease RusA